MLNDRTERFPRTFETNRLSGCSDRKLSATERTLAVYDRAAAQYAARTRDLDMSQLYPRLLSRLPPGAHVLVAGTGTGRDALAFRRMGFRVSAFDASSELALEASALLGFPVPVMRHQDLDAIDVYDGIWACATLLHVPEAEMCGVLRRYGRALKPSGWMYASYKWGEGEESDTDGRHFTHYTPERFASLLFEVPSLCLRESWESGDTLGRGGVRWLNLLLHRR